MVAVGVQHSDEVYEPDMPFAVIYEWCVGYSPISLHPFTTLLTLNRSSVRRGESGNSCK